MDLRARLDALVAATAADQPAFSAAAIDVIAEFQSYGGSTVKSAREQKVLFGDVWPASVRKFSGNLYRLVGLPPRVVANLAAGKDYNYTKPSSWTKSQAIAEDFLTHHWYDSGENVDVILRTRWPGKCLDIAALHALPEFKAAIEYYTDQRHFFSEGLDYEDSQQEVVLPPMLLKQEMVFATFDHTKGRWQRQAPARAPAAQAAKIALGARVRVTYSDGHLYDAEVLALKGQRAQVRWLGKYKDHPAEWLSLKQLQAKS